MKSDHFSAYLKYWHPGYYSTLALLSELDDLSLYFSGALESATNTAATKGVSDYPNVASSENLIHGAGIHSTLKEYCAFIIRSMHVQGAVDSPKPTVESITSAFEYHSTLEAADTLPHPINTLLAEVLVRCLSIACELHLRLMDAHGMNEAFIKLLKQLNENSQSKGLIDFILSSTYQDLTERHKHVVLNEYHRLTDNDESARIPKPKTAQVLWRQHKYSVLARDPNQYKAIGKALAMGKQPIEMWINPMLNALRLTPTLGGIRNAIQHMWGYVSEPSLNKASSPLETLIDMTQKRAMERSSAYLIESTALSDLMCWYHICKDAQ